MNIGLIKDIKTEENRVALQPFQVKVLIENGHNVYVEKDAGVKSGFSDNEYKEAGGIISDKKEVLSKGKLLLKVKAPLESEYDDYQADQTLFTYLHFDENIPPEKIKKLIKSGFLGIAYEWVEKDGKYPLLEPMSRLTGYLFVQKAIEFCARHKGVLCGKYENYLQGSNILILGVGTIGMSALKYSVDNGLKVTVLDKHPETLNDRLNKRFDTGDFDYVKEYGIEIIKFNNENPVESRNNISEMIHKFDIVMNCAVRRPDLPKEKLDFLINRDMVKKMQKNSVICDTTACDGDLTETCISHEELEKVEVVEDVIHYNCDHIPSSVGNTASKLLTEQTFPYILELANKGSLSAIQENEALQNGASCFKGKVTHKYSAEKKGFDYVDILDLI